MTDLDSEVIAPVSFAGGTLDPYRHVCAFVNSRDEEHLILDRFVSDGLVNGDKVVYILDPLERATLVRRLGHLGHDMPTLLEQRTCEVHTWSETYLRGGQFDQTAMLGLLDGYLGSSRSPRVRVVANMGWAVEEQDFSRVMLEYEARANSVYPKHEHIVICVYDIAKFGSDVLIDVLRTHPMALIGGVLQVNPYFVPAEAFLEELRSRDRQATDA